MKKLNAKTVFSARERIGKIAILPFDFISNDSSINVKVMSSKLQNSCYISLKENTRNLQIQDPITTNNILLKNGFNDVLKKTKTPAEVALLLGVEYVVYGVANIDNVGEYSSNDESITSSTNTVQESVNKPEDKNYNYKDYSVPQIGYHFSYNENSNKVIETITNDLGNLQFSNTRENGQIVRGKIRVNDYNEDEADNYDDVEEKKIYANSSLNKVSSSSVGIIYNTVIDLVFYNDQGASMYAKTRNSYGSDIDSYLSTLKYLIKRCPFGSKAKKSGIQK